MTSKGIILLSEARSGSNWVAARMIRNRGWGRCREWFNPVVSKLSYSDAMHAEAWLSRATEAGCSPRTGVFATKVFTHHFFLFHQRFGFDPLARLGQQRSLLFLLLERRDRIAQAISLDIARQTGAWKSTSSPRADAVYDFHGILRAYMKISASYDFWNSYCELRSLPAQRFFYEDLSENMGPWLKACAAFTGVRIRKVEATPLAVQRDGRNLEWAERFRAELPGADIAQGAYPSKPGWKRQALGLLTGRPFPGQFTI